MRNISGLNYFLGIFFVFLGALTCPLREARANALENIGKAVIEKYEETSKPLFEAEESSVKEKLKGDPFFDKMRKKQVEFTKEAQLRRRNFIEKARSSDWSNEKRQEKLADFQRKEVARRKKFADKQQGKILKHNEEGS